MSDKTRIDDELARKILGVDERRRAKITGGSAASGRNNDDSSRDAFVNPMTSVGDIIVGGTAGTPSRLPKGTDGQVLTVDSAETLDLKWATPSGGSGSLVVQEGDVTVAAAATTLDFDASDFNITESPSGEANIALNYGTGAGQPAEGNHTHAYAIEVQEGDSVVTALATVLDFDASDFNVTDSPAGEANIALNYGTGAGQPAEGNHTHTSAGITDFTEATQDVVGALVVAEDGIEATYNDGAGTLTIGFTGTAVDFSQDLQEAPFLRPGFLAADTTTEHSPTDGRAFAHYLGQAPMDISEIELRTQVTTAFVAGTGTSWAEVAVGTSPDFDIAGNATITRQGSASNVAASFNSTGSKTVTITGLTIPAGSHIWVLHSQKIGSGGTLFKLRGGLGESPSSGLNQFLNSQQLSTMSGATAFAITSGAASMAIWYAQWTLVSSGGLGGGGQAITFDVKDSGSLVDDAVDTLDFGAGFNVTEAPSHEINVEIDSTHIDSLIDIAIEADDSYYAGSWLFTHKYGETKPIRAGTTFETYGIGAPTNQGTTTINADDNEGTWISHSVSTNGSLAGRTATTDTYRPDWDLTFLAYIKTVTPITSMRTWIGLSAVTLTGTDTPNGSLAAFRFSTSVPDTTWKCVSGNSSANQQITDSGITVVADTRYEFRIRINTTSVKFYINGSLVATHETHCPASGALMGYWATITNLVGGAARLLKVGRIAIGSRY